MSNIDSEDCLYKLACECECFFDQLQDAPTTINPDLCAEFQQRFAIWAANLGALARKSQCLDTRLRDFPDLQDLVARLLDILRRNIQLCMVTTSCQDDESLVPPGFEAQYRPSEIQSAALRTIDDTLTRLNRLGVRIRQSSNSKLDARIRKFAAGVNLEPFEYLCAFAVQMLYPNAHQALKSYLGKSMAKRYATMLFINSRQETLKKRREPLPMIPEVPSGKTQTSAPATQPTRVINNSIMTSITTTHSALSQSDLSSVNIQEIRNSGRPPDEASTKRYKTSSIQINQTNYPRPPIAELDISIRTCPWCAKLLSNTLSESEWRRHVDEDFEPYICLSEECLETHPAYPNFDDWFKHMRLHSQRWHERFYLSSSWVCAVCEANPEVYTSPHALYSHMERSHSDGFTNEQLEIISRQSKLDQPRSGNDCLLCCFVVGEQAISGEVVFPKRRKRGVKQENTKASRRALEMVNPDPHSPNLLDTSSDSDDTDTPRDQSQQQNEDRSVAMARHVAAHLQTLMFLTLRFADIQNYNGRLDDDIKSDSVEIDEGNGSLERNDVARLSDVVSDSDIVMTDTTGNMDSTTAVIDIDDFVEDEIVIPDTNLDLSDIPRQYDGLMPENDDFLRKLIDSGAYQPSRIKHEIPSPVSPPPVASTESATPIRHIMIPFKRKEHFIGRDTILNQLLQVLPPSANKDDCQRIILEGHGGIGKTEIALEAAYRVLDKYTDCSVFWVPALDLLSFENAYRNIGRRLEFAGVESDGIDANELVKAGLSNKSAGSWLLIIDNVDDIETFFHRVELADCLPSSRDGSILFTTRKHEAAVRLHVPLENTIIVQEMSDDDAIGLLSTGLTKSQICDTEDNKQLIRVLSNFPLAIKIASAFLASNTNIMASQYLELCNSDDTGIDMAELVGTYFEDNSKREYVATDSVAMAWLISFKHILRHSTPAAKCFKIASILAETSILLPLLPEASPAEGIAAIETLKAYALVIEHNEPHLFSVHRLHRFLMWNWLRQNRDWERQISDAILQLSKVYPDPEHSNREELIKYLPHAQAVLDLAGVPNNAQSAILAMKVARSYWGFRKYDKAENMFRQLLSLQTDPPSRGHPDTIVIVIGLGLSLESQGKYEEAEKYYRQALETLERPGGPDANTFKIMKYLASVLEIQEKYEEVEKIHRQTLALRGTWLDALDPATLDSMHGLAIALYHQGKFAEAEELNRRTLERRQTALGREHPNTLAGMHSLAIILECQEKYEEAEELYRQTLDLRQKVLGREHPATLNSMHDLAIALYHQGKFAEAEELNRRTLERRQRVLGMEHPNTLASMHNLAITLDYQEKHEEAEELYRQTLDLRQKVLGGEHPTTLGSVRCLAGFLVDQNRWEEAEVLHRQAAGTGDIT